MFFFPVSPKFWENLTHPLMTGIQSDVDEVSIIYLDIYLQKKRQALY